MSLGLGAALTAKKVSARGWSAVEAEPKQKPVNHPARSYGGQQGEALVPSYAVGPADVGLSGEPSVSSALCVPNWHGRTIERLVGRSLDLQPLPQPHGDLL